ncbi:14761_t:CDS:2, partial [Funneliformis mosseae]
MNSDYVNKYKQYVEPSYSARHTTSSSGSTYRQGARNPYDQELEVSGERIEREIADNERWEVHHIVSKRYTNGRPEFLVYWKGYSKPSWEPAEVLDNCQDESESTKFDTREEIKKIDHRLRKSYHNIRFDDSIYERVVLGDSSPLHTGPKIEQLHFDEFDEDFDLLVTIIYKIKLLKNRKAICATINNSK